MHFQVKLSGQEELVNNTSKPKRIKLLYLWEMNCALHLRIDTLLIAVGRKRSTYFSLCCAMFAACLKLGEVTQGLILFKNIGSTDRTDTFIVEVINNS